MYYLCSENKGADQLRGYREADLRLCFRICKKPVFSRRGSFMEDIVVSMEGVTKLLKDLNSSKALGPDELHLIGLKILARELGPVIAHLLQKSIDTGEIHKECEIHKEWSHVNISPLQKGRQVACLQLSSGFFEFFDKFLENIFFSNIMTHLDQHRLLSDKQYAFMKLHSCETQLTTVTDDLAKILENQGQVDAFILDFEKAFDTSPHKLHINKLFSYGIGGNTYHVSTPILFRTPQTPLLYFKTGVKKGIHCKPVVLVRRV